MIKDRGNKKWQPAMMLPEYAKLLSEAKADLEQKMQEIEMNIHEAISYRNLVAKSTAYHG